MLFIFFLITTATTVAGTCIANGDKEIDGNCYTLVNQRLSFEDARQWCHNANAVLAYVPDSLTNNFLASYARSSFSTAYGYFWIGLSRTSTSSPWQWDNGAPVGWKNLANDLSYNFVAESVANGKWNTMDHRQLLPFVCSYDTAVVPTEKLSSTTTKIAPITTTRIAATSSKAAPSTTTIAPTTTTTTIAPKPTEPAPTTTTTRKSSTTTILVPTTTRIVPTTTTTIAPTTPKIAPTTTRAFPTTKKVVPLTTRKTPATTRHAPITTRHPLFTTKRAPITTRKMPITTRKTPTTTRHAPITTRKTPITTRHPLFTTKRAPVTTRKVPTTTRHAPITTRKMLITTRKAPITNKPTTKKLLPTTRTTKAPAPPTRSPICRQTDPTTFFFAYSNDLDKNTILKSLDYLDTYSTPAYTLRPFSKFAVVRFDVHVEETVQFFSSMSQLTAFVRSRLSNPVLCFKNHDPTNAIKVVHDFALAHPVCGTNVVLLVKRNAAKQDISETVKLLQHNHFMVLTAASDQLVGGSTPQPLYELSTRTNGFCAFGSTVSGDFFKIVNHIAYMITHYLVYAVNVSVHGQGTKQLEVLSSAQEIRINPKITAQGHPLTKDYFSFSVNLGNHSWNCTNPKRDKNSKLQGTICKDPAEWSNFQGQSRVTLNYNYPTSTETLQLRWWSFTSTEWPAYDKNY